MFIAYAISMIYLNVLYKTYNNDEFHRNLFICRVHTTDVHFEQRCITRVRRRIDQYYAILASRRQM